MNNNTAKQTGFEQEYVVWNSIKVNLIYYKDTYVFGRGESSIKFDYIPFTLTDELIKECLSTKSELLERISNITKKSNQEITSERNDVYIYKTIFYPPKSTPPKRN